MHRLVWLSLTVILVFFGTYGFMNAVYWVIIGHDVEYGVGFIAGTFVFPLILYYAAYKSWTKTRAADKQKEKKEYKQFDNAFTLKEASFLSGVPLRYFHN